MCSSNKSAQILRSAAILYGAAEFRKDVCAGNLNYEVMGKRKSKSLDLVPLCSVAYKYMFHACRLPSKEENMDSYAIYDPSIYTHCIIARKGLFFKMDFIDKSTHDPLPIGIIEARLQKIIDLADSMEESYQLGILTTDHRDNWADAREVLVQNDLILEDLEKLESGAFLLCLDEAAPLSRSQCASLFWHGGNSLHCNRWFDKSLQFICTANGKVGFVGEHSMMDGMPTLNLCKYIEKVDYVKARDRTAATMSSNCKTSSQSNDV